MPLAASFGVVEDAIENPVLTAVAIPVVRDSNADPEAGNTEAAIARRSYRLHIG